MILINLMLFILSAIVLSISGALLVKSVVRIASFLRVSEYVMGFIIIAFATSVPELFVGITSALAKSPALAVGNVIGSNIADITLVMGITLILARSIKIKSKNIREDTTFANIIVVLPLVLMFIGGQISRIDGAILLGVFVVYTYMLIKSRKRFTKKIENKVRRLEIVVMTLIFIFSLVILFLSANYVVKYAGLLSIDLFLPPIFIGLFLISLGTTLPELVFGSKAVMTGHSELSLGNLIGSVVVNSTLVLAVTALIYPIKADVFLFFTSAIFMVMVVFLFSTFVKTGEFLNWRHGISLLMMYVFFLIVELSVRGLIV